MSAVLLDTNVVLRLLAPASPEHAACLAVVEALLERGDEPCLAPQVLYELWVVATRPRSVNGFGWQPAETAAHVRRLCELLTLLPEIETVFPAWLALVEQGVSGNRAHDTRLVAFMQLHGIKQIITLNTVDFDGFPVIASAPDAENFAPSTSSR